MLARSRFITEINILIIFSIYHAVLKFYTYLIFIFIQTDGNSPLQTILTMGQLWHFLAQCIYITNMTKNPKITYWPITCNKRNFLASVNSLLISSGISNVNSDCKSSSVVYACLIYFRYSSQSLLLPRFILVVGSVLDTSSELCTLSYRFAYSAYSPDGYKSPLSRQLRLA